MAKKQRSVSSKVSPTFAGIQRGVVSSEFNPDYSHIKGELKKIGVLAASFFSILIVLSFIIK
jgi:hypothetical protein